MPLEDVSSKNAESLAGCSAVSTPLRIEVVMHRRCPIGLGSGTQDTRSFGAASDHCLAAFGSPESILPEWKKELAAK